MCGFHSHVLTLLLTILLLILRLIQSAVDGYNVCIFAYGQTGSGKTFTMIGDKEQNHPGIAPRSFKAIYELIEENSGKFSFSTSIYMMELYRDQLIDLFAADPKNPAKLDIKKDKKVNNEKLCCQM